MSGLAYWLALSAVRGVGSRRFQSLLDAFGSPEAAWHASEVSLAAARGVGPAAAAAVVDARRTLEPARLLARVQQSGSEALTWLDPRYPEVLRMIYDPPPVLYVQGKVSALSRAVAVVGSRKASAYGLEVAAGLAYGLAAAGVTVVSGLARGIDGAAHEGALAAGGVTWAVLGCGLDRVYPPEHRPLGGAIRREGLLLAEVPPGTPPQGENFPARNRIISGLSQAVVVVEAGARSGALITAEAALEQGREVMAVPGPVTDSRSAGANRLLKDGALLVEGAADVLQALGWAAGSASAASACAGGPGGDGSVLLDLLGPAPVAADSLALRLGWGPARLQAALALLELGGWCSQLDDGRVIGTRRRKILE